MDSEKGVENVECAIVEEAEKRIGGNKLPAWRKREKVDETTLLLSAKVTRQEVLRRLAGYLVDIYEWEGKEAASQACESITLTKEEFLSLLQEFRAIAFERDLCCDSQGLWPERPIRGGKAI